MTTTNPTHEKQVSTTRPWLWLITGGGIVAVTGLWAAFAALYEQLSAGTGIAMIGLMLFGGLLVLVGIPERRRAEDWSNWQEPARHIAEIHATVSHLDDLLQEIRKNQILLLSRPGAEDAKVNGLHGMPPEVWQIDVAEAYRLGQQNPRAGDDPPTPN